MRPTYRRSWTSSVAPGGEEVRPLSDATRRPGIVALLALTLALAAPSAGRISAQPLPFASQGLARLLAEAAAAEEREAWTVAAELLRSARRVALRDPDVLLRLAAVLEKSGSSDEAIPVYREILEIDPGMVAAAENLAAALSSNGDLEGAVWLLERTLEHRPESGSLHYHRGLLLVQQAQGPTHEAKRELQRARELGFDRPHLYLMLGRAARVEEGAENALTLLDEGLARAPDDPQLLRERGLVLADLGKFDAAVRDLERALASEAGALERVKDLITVLLRAERPAEALGLLERYEWENDTDLLYFAARARRAVGHPAAAETMERYRRVAQRDRAEEASRISALTDVRAGIVAWENGDLSRAASLFRSAATERPGWSVAGSYLATALLALGREKEAVERAESVLAADPRNSQAMIVVGKARLDEDPAAALDVLERAVDLYPYRNACLLALGEAYVAVERISDAVEIFRRASEVDPEDAWIRERLEALSRASGP